MLKLASSHFKQHYFKHFNFKRIKIQNFHDILNYISHIEYYYKLACFYDFASDVSESGDIPNSKWSTKPQTPLSSSGRFIPAI